MTRTTTLTPGFKSKMDSLCRTFNLPLKSDDILKTLLNSDSEKQKAYLKQVFSFVAQQLGQFNQTALYEKTLELISIIAEHDQFLKAEVANLKRLSQVERNQAIRAMLGSEQFIMTAVQFFERAPSKEHALRDLLENSTEKASSDFGRVMDQQLVSSPPFFALKQLFNFIQTLCLTFATLTGLYTPEHSKPSKKDSNEKIRYIPMPK